MAKNETYKTQEHDIGKRLDVFLVEKTGLSRNIIIKHIKNGNISIDKKIVGKGGLILQKGSTICFHDNSLAQNTVKKPGMFPFKEKIEIVHNDKHYIVVNKPANLLTHPTQAWEKDTVASRALSLFPEIKSIGESKNRPGIVHRLDKEASGLLVIAKTQKMFDFLKKQFQQRSVLKEYIVLVYGNIKQDHWVIDFPIDRGREGKMVSRPRISEITLKNVGKMQVGKEATTEFFVEKRFSRYTLLKVIIHTGRTHQIRVHMLAFNHPVVGDNLYFNKKFEKKNDKELNRLFLHSSRLCFEDLEYNKKCFESKLPEELINFLKCSKDF